MCRVTDLYNDLKVFYKTIQRGEGTQSPYNDCRCGLRVKIEVDDEVKVDQFKIGVIEQFEVIAGDTTPYDLEEYEIPAVVRKILKKTKPMEIVQVMCVGRVEKLTDHLEDKNGVFQHEFLANFQEKVVITF